VDERPHCGRDVDGGPCHGPEAVAALAFRRGLSEDMIALGAIRLATTPSPTDCGLPLPLSEEAVEALWHDVHLPAATTPRENALVYGVL
jgi:hypothetical protein